MNMTVSKPTATLSARARNHARVLRMRSLFDRVDLIDHALRPGLGKVGSQIGFLHMGPEGVYVGGVDVEALVLEELRQVILELELLQATRFGCVVGGFLHGGLLVGAQAVPDLLR